MLSQDEFRQYGHAMIDWIADYLEKIEDFPVKSTMEPGALRQQLPQEAPFTGESMDVIFTDFKKYIPDGLTHWQHPGFMALFPSNSSFASVLGELLAAGVGINAMMWDTSPSATELEETVMEWLRKASGLPEGWKGVIQDTASASTLTAILTAREKCTQFNINAHGFAEHADLLVYCTAHTHYSIEKGAKAAGFGADHVIKIPTDNTYAMRADALEERIQADLQAGKKPCIVIATLGTTGTLAFDPLKDIATICNRYGIWLHVDAAYAGSAFILPEYQHYLDGITLADSYVFNAHKWMFTNFDCSCYFVKDNSALIHTFSANPAYLKRTHEAVTQYKDWGLPLGRRFRALKLWFVLRNYGISGLQQAIKTHIQYADIIKSFIQTHAHWKIFAPPALNVLCIRYVPAVSRTTEELNTLNSVILNTINQTGKFYLSGTTVDEQFIIRIVCGGTWLTEQHLHTLIHTLEDAAQSACAQLAISA